MRGGLSAIVASSRNNFRDKPDRLFAMRRRIMGLLDGLLGQVAGNVDIANLAEKVGLPHDQVEQAVAALAHAHPQPGDTVSQASQTTGLSTDVLQQIVGHIGGEGSLGQFASLIESQGGLSALGGLASGLFGKS
jgi:hypothetical protein